MIIEFSVYEGIDEYSSGDGIEIKVKPNSRYCDTLDVLYLLEEAIYEALESAEIEVTNE